MAWHVTAKMSRVSQPLWIDCFLLGQQMLLSEGISQTFMYGSIQNITSLPPAHLWEFELFIKFFLPGQKCPTITGQ
jgi:hypothetical protein